MPFTEEDVAVLEFLTEQITTQLKRIADSLDTHLPKDQGKRLEAR